MPVLLNKVTKCNMTEYYALNIYCMSIVDLSSVILHLKVCWGRIILINSGWNSVHSQGRKVLEMISCKKYSYLSSGCAREITFCGVSPGDMRVEIICARYRTPVDQCRAAGAASQLSLVSCVWGNATACACSKAMADP